MITALKIQIPVIPAQAGIQDVEADGKPMTYGFPPARE